MNGNGYSKELNGELHAKVNKVKVTELASVEHVILPSHIQPYHQFTIDSHDTADQEYYERCQINALVENLSDITIHRVGGDEDIPFCSNNTAPSSSKSHRQWSQEISLPSKPPPPAYPVHDTHVYGMSPHSVHQSPDLSSREYLHYSSKLNREKHEIYYQMNHVLYLLDKFQHTTRCLNECSPKSSLFSQHVNVDQIDKIIDVHRLLTCEFYNELEQQTCHM